MVRLVVCLALLVVGAIGKELPIPEDSIIDDQLSDIKDGIPYDIPEGHNAETIPMSGNFAIQNEHSVIFGMRTFFCICSRPEDYSVIVKHCQVVLSNSFSMTRMYHRCKWRLARTSTAFNSSEYSELLQSESRRNYFIG